MICLQRVSIPLHSESWELALFWPVAHFASRKHPAPPRRAQGQRRLLSPRAPIGVWRLKKIRYQALFFRRILTDTHPSINSPSTNPSLLSLYLILNQPVFSSKNSYFSPGLTLADSLASIAPSTLTLSQP